MAQAAGMCKLVQPREAAPAKHGLDRTNVDNSFDPESSHTHT